MSDQTANKVEATPRTTVRRVARLGVSERAAINAILDEALTSHVGIVDDGQPFVIPMLHVRVDDRLYVHGAVASRLMRAVGAGAPACIAVTLVDGLVLARSLLHHSLNYRSVVILACGEEVKDRDAKMNVLKHLTEHAIPGRWAEARHPSENELAATAIVGFSLEECSAKVRTGPPIDDEADYDLSVWAGELPLSLAVGRPVPDPKMAPGTPVPRYILDYARPPAAAP